jgi:hypothetical protein
MGSCSPRVVFPLVRHGLGDFFWRRTRGSEMMEVCASGFAKHRRGYFISSRGALGVMTDWRVLMRIPNDGGFPWTRRVFSSKQCSWFPNEDFLRILRQGASVCVCSARGKVPKCVQNSEDSYAQIKEVITKRIQKIDFHFYFRNSITPSTN